MLSFCLLALVLMCPPAAFTQSSPLHNQRAPDWMLWDAFFLHLTAADKLAKDGWKERDNLTWRIGVEPECLEILISLAKSYYETRDSMWKERNQLLAQSNRDYARLKQLERDELSLAYIFRAKVRSAVSHEVFNKVLSWINREVAPRVVPFSLPKDPPNPDPKEQT